MTGDICLLCTRNRTRRWLKRHVPQISGGMTGSGLTAIAATWQYQGAAGWACFLAGYFTLLTGLAGGIAWAFGWRPSFRWPGRAVRRWARNAAYLLGPDG